MSETCLIQSFNILIMNHLECVTSKNNKWYWYLLVLFLSFVASQTVGSIPLLFVVIAAMFKNGFDASMFEGLSVNFKAAGIDLNLALACMLFIFAVLLIAAIVFIKLIHGRTWQQVINGTSRVRWSRFFFGFLVWGVISLILFAISFITEPEVIRFQFQPEKFFILLVIVLTLIPLQTTAEEFLFRGYMAQGIASVTKSRWWILIIPSLLFGLMHAFNPEIKEYGFAVMMPQYIFLGLLLGFMSIMDDGIELAMGVHAVNNLLGGLLVTYKGGALQTYALFELTEINPSKEILPLFISGIVIIAIFAAKYKWDFKIINKPVNQPPSVPPIGGGLTV